ncbi:MAG: DUF2490 domain-containing protein [Vampirovibrionales bacterium]|nr:DUF2490 domain-containing protein [Vampirovibrionales bacterium]
MTVKKSFLNSLCSLSMRYAFTHRTARQLLVWLAFSLLVAGPSAHAAENELALWVPVTLEKKMLKSSKHPVRLMLEVTPRQADDLTNFEQLIIRPAVGVQLTKSISVWQGYAWTPLLFNNRQQTTFNDEHRLYQQLLFEKTFFKKLGVTNRWRFEERFIEGEGEVALRSRNLTRLSWPLDAQKKWAAILSNETFFNWNTTSRDGIQRGFDQDRIFVGINRELNPHVNAEAGYMLRIWNRPNATPDKFSHIILVGVNVNL